jgi:GntR family transcriptional regulator
MYMADDQVPPFVPRPGAYVYMEVADHVARQIEAGTIPAGAKLAGERELAEQYGVALGTARRAVEELRERSLVVTLPAKGTYVREQDDESPAGQ